MDGIIQEAPFSAVVDTRLFNVRTTAVGSGGLVC